MKLEKFVSNTLTDLVNAVQNTNEKFKSKASFELNSEEGIIFDIAVTISEKEEGTKEGGISVYSIKLGGKKGSSNLNENVSRIKFKVKPQYSIK